MSATPSTSAACTVAVRSASAGAIPASTMYSNSPALSPCGPTPESVPNAMRTPARCAFAKVCWISAPTRAAFGLTMSGK